MIFETHAHYDDEAFNKDREEILTRMQADKIGYIVNVSSCMETCKSTIALTERYPFIYGAIGVHPSDTLELNEENIKWMEKKCALDKIVAVGEIGLDYHWDEPEREIQKKWFIKQLELAKKVDLPLIIHSREAAQDTLNIIKEQKAYESGGVIHCFSYDLVLAKEYLKMGFYIGVGGVLTFKNAKKLREVVAYAPIEKIVLETDCPYLAPEPYRGKRNNSTYLQYVIEEIANIKGINKEIVEEITTTNAKTMYRINS